MCWVAVLCVARQARCLRCGCSRGVELVAFWGTPQFFRCPRLKGAPSASLNFYNLSGFLEIWSDLQLHLLYTRGQCLSRHNSFPKDVLGGECSYHLLRKCPTHLQWWQNRCRGFPDYHPTHSHCLRADRTKSEGRGSIQLTENQVDAAMFGSHALMLHVVIAGDPLPVRGLSWGTRVGLRD